MYTKRRPPISCSSKETIEKTEARILKKLPRINKSSRPIIPLGKIYKWLLNSSVPPAKNKSKIFEKDYEVRTDDVNFEDDEEFRMSGQHLSRQLRKGLRNAQATFHSSDSWGLRISAKYPIKTPRGRILELSAWIYKITDGVMQTRPSLTTVVKA